MMTDGSVLEAPAAGRMVPAAPPQQQQQPEVPTHLSTDQNTESKLVMVAPEMLERTESDLVDRQPQQPAEQPPATPPAAAPEADAQPSVARTEAAPPALATAADQPSTGLSKLERETALLMLNLLSKYKEADPFRQPVDWLALGIPDYPDVIKQPMDLRTVREKVRSGAYSSMHEWRADMALIWSNCRKYNGDVHHFTKMAEKLEAAMERRMDEAVAGATRELAAQQQRAAEGGGASRGGAPRPKIPRELALLRSSNTSAGSDSDGGEDVKPLARVASWPRPSSMPGSRMDQARSSDTAGAAKSPDVAPLRLSLKRVASGGNMPAATGGAAAATAAADGKAGLPKRKAASNSLGGAGGSVPGVNYDSLELLTNTQAAKQLGVADADDLAFLAVWKRVIGKRGQAEAEADGLRQTNKKLRRSVATAEEEVKSLRAMLEAEKAARTAADKKHQDLQKQHAQLQEQHKQQHQVLEHQRQLLEQQQQVLRQVLKQQQAQQQPSAQQKQHAHQQQQHQTQQQQQQQQQQQPVQQEQQHHRPVQEPQQQHVAPPPAQLPPPAVQREPSPVLMPVQHVMQQAFLNAGSPLIDSDDLMQV